MAPGALQRALQVVAVCGLAYALERWPRATQTGVMVAAVASYIVQGNGPAKPEVEPVRISGPAPTDNPT